MHARIVVDPATADQLVQAFTAFARTRVPAWRCWVAGGTFCSGHDLKFAATLADPEKFWHEVTNRLALDAEGRGRGGAFERGVL